MRSKTSIGIIETLPSAVIPIKIPMKIDNLYLKLEVGISEIYRIVASNQIIVKAWLGLYHDISETMAVVRVPINRERKSMFGNTCVDISKSKEIIEIVAKMGVHRVRKTQESDLRITSIFPDHAYVRKCQL